MFADIMGEINLETVRKCGRRSSDRAARGEGGSSTIRMDSVLRGGRVEIKQQPVSPGEVTCHSILNDLRVMKISVSIESNLSCTSDLKVDPFLMEDSDKCLVEGI